jgi:hypothetical protein
MNGLALAFIVAFSICCCVAFGLANADVELKEQGYPAHTVIETLKMEQHSRLADLYRSTSVSDPDSEPARTPRKSVEEQIVTEFE